MIAKIGTVVQTEFGTGPIVAITDMWVIHKVDGVDGVEFAVLKQDSWIGIPADVSVPDVKPETTMDISVE